jgi:hypothetical protein
MKLRFIFDLIVRPYGRTRKEDNNEVRYNR